MLTCFTTNQTYAKQSIIQDYHYEKKIQKSCPKHEQATPDFSGMAHNEKKHPHLEVYHISQRDIPEFINGELQVLINERENRENLAGVTLPYKEMAFQKACNQSRLEPDPISQPSQALVI